jgi:diguanylate cyclase (GGDEF)-like protein/PAS domain S-box-containing protein
MAGPVEQPREKTRYRAIVESAGEGIWVTDAAGRTIFANPRLASMLAVSPATLAGASMHDFLSPGDREVLHAVEGADRTQFEARLVRADGAPLWVIVRSTPFATGDELGGDGTLHVVTDITDRKRREDALGRLALHDPLTGLPNRARLNDRLEHALQRRGDHTAAVLFLDLDNFKDVNDSFGHAAGDRLLRDVASRLADAARDGDTVGRFGGDEFVVVCDEIGDADNAEAVARRLGDALRAPFSIGAADVFVTASIGVAVTPPSDATTLFRHADAAMYRAKERGRATVVRYDTAVEHAASSRIRVHAELRRALAEDQLRVWYQPIVDLGRGRVVAVEALVRWMHPTRGLLAPGAFLAVAETSGLVRDVGAVVLDLVCADVAAWPRARRERRANVNLAAAQLADDGFVTQVRDEVAAHGLAPDRLTFEVTEAAAMHDRAATEHTLLALRELGARVALDDFGTGYSSLSFLRGLPVDAVKIDRSFVSGLGADRDDARVVAGVVGMAAALGHAVVAEGVETVDQLARLRSLGCRYGQGFLWSPPVPPAELSTVVARIEASSAIAPAG